MDKLLMHLPRTWQQNQEEISCIVVDKYNDEHLQITKELSGIDVEKFKTFVRYQNLYRYGQFLIRQQHLLKLYPNKNIYTVRRFVTLPAHKLKDALEYNLDERRLGQKVHFLKDAKVDEGDVVLLVKVVTEKPSMAFEPRREYDYYIEYYVM